MKNLKSLQTSILLVLTPILLQAQISEFWTDTLNKTLQREFEDENMNGLAGSIVFSDGSVWSNTQGKHGNENLSTDFLYDIGSNTKSMVATLILLLEEEGKLTLDDTLYKFINPISNVPSGITINQLLKHRSGVYSYTEHPDFFDAIDADENKFWHPDTILSMFLLAPNFSPGAKFEYSNTGYILLGQVVEAIEDKPLHVVLREKIFDPLGLDHIYLDEYDNYSETKTGAWLSPTWYYPSISSFMSSAWAAGGVVAQPEDFATYAHKLLRGDLLSDTSMQKLTDGTPIFGGETYGLGVIESSYNGKTYLGHGGTTLQNSEMEYSVESDFSLVLINLDNGFFDETRRVRNTFLDLVEYIEENHDRAVGIADGYPHVKKAHVYPNPSSNKITIEFQELGMNEKITVQVRDLSGRLVYSTLAQAPSHTILKSQIGSGVYFLSTLKENILIDTEKIIFD